MICPSCGKKFRRHSTWCPECRVPLVAALADVESLSPSLPLELVAVFCSGDPGRLMLAESLLRSADIPYIFRQSRLHSEFQVAPQDAEDARALLSDLADYASGDEATGDETVNS